MSIKELNNLCIMYVTDLFPPNDKGGAEIIAFNEARGMTHAGCSVIVVTTASKRALRITRHQVHDVKVYEIPTLGLWVARRPRALAGTIHVLLNLFDPLSYFSLRKIIHKEQPRLVHAHNIPRISFGALRAVKKPTKLVQTYHSYFYECPKGGLLRKWTSGGKPKICKRKPLPCRFWASLFHRIVPQPDAILAISKYISKQLQKYHWKNVYYCPNGIEYPPEEQGTSPKARLQRGKKVILFVGRLTKAKGVHLLIEAYTKLRSLRDDIQLLIAGDGEEAGNLQKQARRLQCDAIFYGRVSHDQIMELYRYAYVVVIPSLWYEVLNTVAIEASLAGKPIIASDMPGLRDVVIDGVTGLLFQPGNVDALQDKLSLLLSNEQMVDRFGEAAHRHAMQFTLDRHLLLLRNIYSKVLQDGL